MIIALMRADNKPSVELVVGNLYQINRTSILKSKASFKGYKKTQCIRTIDLSV